MNPKRHSGTQQQRGSVLTLVTLMLGVILGLAIFYVADNYLRPVTVAPRAVMPRGDLTQEEKTNVQIFENTAPSVVYITTKQFQRNWFQRSVVEVERGSGSGFIWDENGHIVTNFHVIQGGNTIEVVLHDQSSYEARPVGVYPDKDIAVLKIDAPREKLRPIAVGSAADLKVGQMVKAIGNPFGWDYTFTVGVVSAVNRTIRSITDLEIPGVIQTDAAINPGNSGGPLLDSAGRLIGMNTQIASTSGSNAGIGFAIPVDIINEVVPQLILNGRVLRSGLGINILDYNDNLMRRWRLRGVMVYRVAPDSAAGRAGLRGVREMRDGNTLPGDILIAIGDEPINVLSDYRRVIDRFKVGETIEVTFLRDDKEMKTKVTLQAVGD